VRLRLPLLVAAAAFALTACSGGASSSPAGASPAGASPAGASPTAAAATLPGTPASPTPGATVELTIYGAASLKGVLEKAKAVYEAALPGTTLTISTDSSAALEAKIEQGAPADVFLSADTSNPRKLVEAGLAAGDPVPFAGNELAVIVPADNPAGIRSPADLARSGLKVIAAGVEVPITKYATQLVENLAMEAGYPAGFVAAYAANIVSREDNVRAVVAKIELGEGDAGIVYATDAAASSKVATVDIPGSANVPAACDGVVVRASKNPAAARAFLDWLAGPGGRAILGSFGFLPPAR
jgi:molybdate transport system substrate-binding protein